MCFVRLASDSSWDPVPAGRCELDSESEKLAKRYEDMSQLLIVGASLHVQVATRAGVCADVQKHPNPVACAGINLDFGLNVAAAREPWSTLFLYHLGIVFL